jgi:tRNA-specific 2-thiouridylase
MLDQYQLASTLFPVGEITKEEVRRIATRLGLRTASKPDSQDVCFITSTGGREQFLGRRIPFRRAEVVDTAGRPVGTVDALELVTIGQRRGLGLPGGGPRKYVVAVDHTEAIVTMGSDGDLVDAGLHVTETSWVDGPRVGDVLVQCSAHGAPQAATIVSSDGGIDVNWRVPQRRVAPGQSVVFYDPTDRLVYGGGLAAS